MDSPVLYRKPQLIYLDDRYAHITFRPRIVNIIISYDEGGAHDTTRNGEDRVQNFRTKFLLLCRELCLLTSTYLKINNLRRD